MHESLAKISSNSVPALRYISLQTGNRSKGLQGLGAQAAALAQRVCRRCCRTWRPHELTLAPTRGTAVLLAQAHHACFRCQDVDLNQSY